MFTTFITIVGCLCFVVPGCNWTSEHPKEVKAIEGDLKDIAENLIPGAPHGTRPQISLTP